MQQSLASKPATEAPVLEKGLMKLKNKKGSVKAEKVSDQESSHEPMGTVAPTAN